MRAIFLLLLYICAGQTSAQQKIEGIITDATTGKPLTSTRVSLYQFSFDSLRRLTYSDSLDLSFSPASRRDTIYNRVTQTETDSAGHYRFDIGRAAIYKLKVFHRTRQVKGGWEGEWSETNGFLVEKRHSQQIDFRLPVFCSFDSTANFTHCPRCKRRDAVYKIQHGLLMAGMKPEKGVYYSGYCDVPRCGPGKRCMRCELEF